MKITRKSRDTAVFSVLAFLLTVSYTNCSQTGFVSSNNALEILSSSVTQAQDEEEPHDEPPADEEQPPDDDPPAVLEDDGPLATGQKIVSVSTAAELLQAIAVAGPGDEITLENGVFTLNANINLNRAGAANAYIFIRAKYPLQAKLAMCSVEGFRVLGQARYWVLENLLIEGTCEASNDHAFHIVSSASNIILRNNYIVNFRSHVKVNGDESPRKYPNDLWFIKNIWKTTKLMSERGVPHNTLNIDGGHGLRIRGNVFVDQVAINRSSSSIYVKMGTRDFIVEQNLVVCQKKY